jgi:hypothetical protein
MRLTLGLVVTSRALVAQVEGKLETLQKRRAEAMKTSTIWVQMMERQVIPEATLRPFQARVAEMGISIISMAVATLEATLAAPTTSTI